MENKTVKKEIIINATRDEVWQALTDPEMIKIYFFGTEVITDWKIGSPILFQGEWEGNSYQEKGIILDLIPQKLFKYSYWSSMSGTEDLPENYSIIVYQLVEEESGTTLIITQEGFRDQKAYEDSDTNWGEILNSIKGLLEKNEVSRN